MVEMLERDSIATFRYITHHSTYIKEFLGQCRRPNETNHQVKLIALNKKVYLKFNKKMFLGKQGKPSLNMQKILVKSPYF